MNSPVTSEETEEQSKNTVCAYNRVLYNFEKGKSVTCYNINEPQDYVKQNRPVTKGQVLYDSTHEVSKIFKSIEMENRKVVTKD